MESKTQHLKELINDLFQINGSRNSGLPRLSKERRFSLNTRLSKKFYNFYSRVIDSIVNFIF
jgi:hypothetical protein